MTDADQTRMAQGKQPDMARRALHAIAAFEAIKGVAALAAVIGILDLMHHVARRLAMELIGHFNLNPDARYPSILLHYVDLLPGAHVRNLVFLAFGYILVRALEAYGLWNDRAWGEWLGALSGGIYIPFEMFHLTQRPSIINAAVLAGNIFVVSFLVYRLSRKSRDAMVRG